MPHERQEPGPPSNEFNFSAETIHFHDGQEFAPASPPLAAHRSHAPLPPHNLRAEHTVWHKPFVGRDKELADLHKRLTAPRAPDDTRAEAVVHAIPGEGGIGKTQLVLAYILDSRFTSAWDHRWWLDGSSARFDQSCIELARTVGIHVGDKPDAEAIRAALCALFNQGRKHLLVIDNAEPRDPDKERGNEPIQPWLAYEQLALLPPSRVLLTTRFTDRLTDFAELFDLGVLEPPDALKLLRLARQSFADGHADSDLSAITLHLGYHGLALGYAAAWLTEHSYRSPADLLAQIKAAELGPAHPLEHPDLTGRAARYQRSTAATLWLNLEDLQKTPAMVLLIAAAFCDPERIPGDLLATAAGLEPELAEKWLLRLKSRSILRLAEPTESEKAAGSWACVGLHRLTQSMVRNKAWSHDRKRTLRVLTSLRRVLADALQDNTHHSTFPARVRATPHAVALSHHLQARVDDLPTRHATTLDQFDVAMLCRWLAEHEQQSGDLRGAAAHIEATIHWGEAEQPRNDRDLAVWYASRASIRQDRGDLPGAEEDIARSIAWVESQTPRDERGLAIRYASRARIRQDRGDLLGAEEDIARSIAWGESQTPRDERSLAIDYASRASIRQDRGDLPGAEEDIARSIAWGESQTPRDERSLAILYGSRARIRQDRGDLPGAEEDIARSIAWVESQTPRDERGLAILYGSRARIRQDRGDLLGAEEDIARSIAWGESQTPRDERSLAIDYASRASIRQDRGDLPGAEEDIARSIAWGESQTPRDERSLAILYGSRARIRQDRGDLPGAEEDIARSIAWGESQTPRDERSLAILDASRASIRQDRGDLPGAEEDIARSIAWAQSQMPPDKWGLALWCAIRASIRQARGDLKGAEEDINGSITWFESQTPRNEGKLARYYETQATIFSKGGRSAEARTAIDTSVELHTRVFGPDHEWTRITRARQARIHAGQSPDPPA